MGVLRDILKLPEARRRVGLALVILCVFRAGFHVPVPGLVPAALGDGFIDNVVPDWLAAASQFAAGDANSPVLFALGVLPFLLAALILSLLALVFPSCRALLESGEDGRRRASRYLKYLTLPASLSLASLVVSGLSAGHDSSGFLLISWMGFLQVMTLSAGSLLLLWLCEMFSGLGIGNGMAFLTAAGLLAQAPLVLTHLVERVTASDPEFVPQQTVESAFVLVLCIAVVAGVVYMGRCQHRIPVQVRRRRSLGDDRVYMPVKLRASGPFPLLLAQALALPAAALLGSLPLGTLASYMASFLLVLWLCRVWTRFALQPAEIAENMRSHGTSIPGVDPGKATAERLDRIIERVAWGEAVCLAALILLPPLLLHATGMLPLFQIWIMAMPIIAWAGLDFIEGLERIPLFRPEEPPGEGQPSRLLPVPHGPPARARAEPEPGLEGA